MTYDSVDEYSKAFLEKYIYSREGNEEYRKLMEQIEEMAEQYQEK